LIAFSFLGRFSCSTTVPACGRSTISVSVTCQRRGRPST
jgi:hypothetical protein